MYFRPRVIFRDPNQSKDHVFVRYMGNRVLNKNLNFLCGIVGQTGAGKSWAGGSICKIYEEMFGIKHDPKKHIIHTVEQMLELLNTDNKKDRLPHGTIIIFEEPQVSANSRTWYTLANDVLRQITSIFRSERLIVLFCTPSIFMLDKQVRSLFHATIKMTGYNKKTGISNARPLFLDFNWELNKFYRTRLIIEYAVPGKKAHTVKKLQNWGIPKPPPEWVEEYELMKDEFNKDQYKQLMERYQDTKEGKSKRRLVTTDQLTEIEGLLDKHGEDYISIFKHFPDLAPSTIEKHISWIKRSNLARKGS